MKMMRFSLVLTAVFAVGACGDDSGGTADARRIDAAGPFDSSATCDALETYPDAGALMANAQAASFGDDTGEGQTGYFINWIGLVGDDQASAALVSIELWPGFGMLNRPVAPGTYPLTGEELDYNSCGVCVLAFSELTFDSMGAITDAGELYFTTGGTVTLTTVPPGAAGGGDAGTPDAGPVVDGAASGEMIAGSLASVTLTERDNMVQPVSGGCRSMITGAQFSTDVDPFMAARRPKPALPPSYLEAQRRGLIRHGQLQQ
jgi:hypothetical protein